MDADEAIVLMQETAVVETVVEVNT